MNKKEVVSKTKDFAKNKLYGEGTGHDWWHVLRVWQLAERIGKEEGADLFIVEVSSLLHDIADWKFQKGADDSIGAMVAKEWLESLGVNNEEISQVCEIIKNVSYKGAGVEDKLRTIEGKVVQDADRLDAIGAVGIARCFAYGGSKGRAIYDPSVNPTEHDSFEEYKNNNSPSINHFYEKLLQLKERMNTATGRKMAEERHKFMELYLERFYGEWEGKL